MGDIENKITPLVSISVITYEHEKFIRQCLDGILMQNVNFPYEVLVHDDASTDRTADIIRGYERQYPGTVKPIYQIENQYSKGRSVSRFNLDRACGKYLAFCEGDDYWTDPGKLQKQVDFLEAHPEYIACVHRVQVIDEFGNIDRSNGFARNYGTSDYTLSDAENCLIHGACASHPSSLVCRNIFSTLPEDIYENFFNCKVNGDIKLSLLLTLNGAVRRFDEIMSVYRHITSGGHSWSARHANKNNCLLVYNYLKELSKFSQISYGVRLDYADYKNHLALLSVYEYVKHPNKDNMDITCRLLSRAGNKLRLMRHIFKYKSWYIHRLASKEGNAPANY